MNISTHFLIAASRAYAGQVQNGGEPANQMSTVQADAAGTSARKSDAVQLSQSGREVQRLRDQMQVLPTACEDRVAALKQEIAGGTYQVDRAKLAQRLLGL